MQKLERLIMSYSVFRSYVCFSCALLSTLQLFIRLVQTGGCGEYRGRGRYGASWRLELDLLQREMLEWSNKAQWSSFILSLSSFLILAASHGLRQLMGCLVYLEFLLVTPIVSSSVLVTGSQIQQLWWTLF